MADKVPEDFEDLLKFMVKNTPDKLSPHPDNPPSKAELERRHRLVETKAPNGERRWASVEVKGKTDADK